MTQDTQQRYQAARRYASLIMKPRHEWTTDDELFVQDYKAHLAWITNGKGEAR